MKLILYTYPVTLFLFVLFLFTGYNTTAQTNQWNWVSGDNTTNRPGVYGTMGVAADLNNPGGRMYAASWTDGNNLWLFGGLGYDASGHQGALNDLWKFNTTTKKWTWINGNNIQYVTGVYGTKNIAAPANQPGARWNATTWIDAAGNLWLFGGNGLALSNVVGYLNDLWKFDIGLGQWIWMNGDNVNDEPGVYGTRNSGAATNRPGARLGAAGFTDSNGNLWLFGGQGFAGSSFQGFLNDLWRYDITSGVWGWVNGSDTIGAHGSFGVKNIPAAGNNPGARFMMNGWKDNNGNWWLFGGVGAAAAGAAVPAGLTYLNDLWKYNIVSGEWVWVNGDSVYNTNGVYGTKNVATTGNEPGARYGAVNWRDSRNNLWLYGGTGFASSGASGGALSDLWKYDINAGQWTWVNGESFNGMPAIYGTKGTGAPGNTPGARANAASWITADNSLWLFAGGSSQNDLWVYQPDLSLLPVQLTSVTASVRTGHVLLSWRTEDEQNMRYYTIQRSMGDNQWKTIGVVYALSGGGGHNYQYMDNSPHTGINYYRVQPTDEGGILAYSKIVSATLHDYTTQVQAMVDKGTLHVVLQNGGAEKYLLFTADGRLYKKGVLQNGKTSVPCLIPGLYYLKIMLANETATQKVIVP